MVKELTGQAACTVIAAVEAVGGLTGVEGHGDLRKLCGAVVVDDNAAVFVDGVIFVVLFVHCKILSFV